MGDFTGTTTVHASGEALFAYLRDVGNMPEYFARMTSARPGEGEEIITTARTPDGQEVQGDAWFRVDEDAQRIAWGSEGHGDYHGHLDLRPAGDSCEVEVHLHTERVPDGSAEVQHGVEETLATIKRVVEERGIGR